MVAPSKNFTVIPDSSVDADSPLTADLMEDIRDNDIHLEEWVGKNYTAAVDHDHDGVNSKSVSLATSFNWLTTTPTILSGGTASAFTDVSIASHTGGATATMAIVSVSLTVTLYGASGVSAAGSATVNMRRNGDTPVAAVTVGTAQCVVSSDGSVRTVGCQGTVLVPVASNIFEYCITSSSISAANTTLKLLGYVT